MVLPVGILYNWCIEHKIRVQRYYKFFIYASARERKMMNFRNFCKMRQFLHIFWGSKRTKINRFIYVTQLLHINLKNNFAFPLIFYFSPKLPKMFYLLPFSYLTMGDSWVIHG